MIGDLNIIDDRWISKMSFIAFGDLVKPRKYLIVFGDKLIHSSRILYKVTNIPFRIS